MAYAISIGAAKIFYGTQGSDEPFYPDCRKEFYKAFEKAARLGTGTEITIEPPFSNLPKLEVLKIGAKLGVSFHLTWSCFLAGEKHCGKCESCVNRKNAFREGKNTRPNRIYRRIERRGTLYHVVAFFAEYNKASSMETTYSWFSTLSIKAPKNCQKVSLTHI